MSPVLVVGTGRSGTTFVARVLHERMGVSMGVFSEGKSGGFENRHLRRVDREYVSGSLTMEEWKRETRQITAEYREPWGYKNPGNATHLDLYLTLWPDAILVWTKRNRNDTVRSWYREYGTRRGRRGALSWEECHRRVVHRHASVATFLRRRSHLVCDMSRRWTEAKMIAYLKDYLRQQHYPYPTGG